MAQTRIPKVQLDTTLVDTSTVQTLSSKTFVAPALGTPASGVATNLTGTAAGLTAGSVTTNANLTGVITSTGNATSIASQTGTGSKFVVDTSPTLVTPNLGTPSALVATNATGTAAALNIGGVAATATALATGRTIAIGGTTGLTATGVSFNGTANISPTLTGTLAVANGGTGLTASDPLVQMVSTITGAVATGTTLIPFDDTIPQSNEGDQYMSLTITPKSTTNMLTTRVVANMSSSVTNNMAIALFQDAGANALAVSEQGQNGGGFLISGSLAYRMAAGTTSATTFKVRIGGSIAGTTTFNGVGGGRIYGGALASSIIIEETVT